MENGMKSLNVEYLEGQPVSLELLNLIQILGEHKGKQELYSKMTPQVLETLKQAAIIQSTESSNRIEGITVVPERLKAILLKRGKPKDRTEAEIIGYRDVLARIHARFDSIEVNTDSILDFHRRMLKGTGITSGCWKQKDNTIEERLEDGRWITRFVPVPAHETPYYMEEICKHFDRMWKKEKVSKLLLAASFILDFLCIHPFTDGNGRISRLLTVLILHKAGYDVTRYIGLERVIEDSKVSYYEILHEASQGWHGGSHNIRRWWEYFLTTIIQAYEELDERMGAITKGRGGKTNIVQAAVENMSREFGISDVERSCPSVGRDMIRVVLNRLREEKKLKCIGKGRGAKWQKLH